jgi:DNA-binding IclR family transcriptional regulator
MVQINAGSREAKIIKALLDKYPIDVKEVAEITGIAEAEVQRLLHGMQDRGWLTLEVLPGRTFIRLRRVDFTFLGRVETQKRAIKHKGRKREKDRIRAKVLADDHDDIMYA